jgi:hypothetical protein
MFICSEGNQNVLCLESKNNGGRVCTCAVPTTKSGASSVSPFVEAGVLAAKLTLVTPPLPKSSYQACVNKKKKQEKIAVSKRIRLNFSSFPVCVWNGV